MKAIKLRTYIFLILLILFLSSSFYLYKINHTYTKYFIIPFTIENVSYKTLNTERDISKHDWKETLSILSKSKDETSSELLSQFTKQQNNKIYILKELYIFTYNDTYVWPIWEYNNKLYLIPGGDVSRFYKVDKSLLKLLNDN